MFEGTDGHVRSVLELSQSSLKKGAMSFSQRGCMREGKISRGSAPIREVPDSVRGVTWAQYLSRVNGK